MDDASRGFFVEELLVLHEADETFSSYAQSGTGGTAGWDRLVCELMHNHPRPEARYLAALNSWHSSELRVLLMADADPRVRNMATCVHQAITNAGQVGVKDGLSESEAKYYNTLRERGF